MRALFSLLIAIAAVATVLFFGLRDMGGDSAVVVPPTVAPLSSSDDSPSANETELREISSGVERDNAEQTLIAVTTTVGLATTTSLTRPLGTLAAVEGIGTPTLDATSSVSTVGIDRIMFGMTVRDAQIAAGSRFTPVTPVGDCFLVVPEAGQAGLTFWVVAGTVERVDVDTRTITTRSGAGIGDTEDQIRELFGERIHTTQLPDGSGNLLAYVPKDVQDATYRVIFLSNGIQITRMWAGRLPWVEELGGCPR